VVVEVLAWMEFHLHCDVVVVLVMAEPLAFLHQLVVASYLDSEVLTFLLEVLAFYSFDYATCFVACHLGLLDDFDFDICCCDGNFYFVFVSKGVSFRYD